MAGNPDRGLTRQVGPVKVDVPRTAGYFGGIGLAVAIGLIEWPVALFLGAIPVIKLLQRSNLPDGVRFAAQVFEGASKPVGGDSAGTITLLEPPARRAPTRSPSRRSSPRRSTGTSARRRSAKAPAAARSGRTRPAAKTTGSDLG